MNTSHMYASRYATKIAWKQGFLRTNLQSISVPEGTTSLTVVVKAASSPIQTETLTVPTSTVFQTPQEWFVLACVGVRASSVEPRQIYGYMHSLAVFIHSGSCSCVPT